MATYTKVQGFVGYLGTGVINANTDLFEVYLTNATPSASLDDVKADLAEIATGNGYTGAADITNTYSETGGTGTCAATDVTFTASGGAIAQFRYVAVFDETVTSPVVDPLICFWDYGSAVDLASGESFTVDFGSDQLFTLA